MLEKEKPGKLFSAVLFREKHLQPTKTQHTFKTGIHGPVMLAVAIQNGIDYSVYRGEHSSKTDDYHYKQKKVVYIPASVCSFSSMVM